MKSENEGLKRRKREAAMHLMNLRASVLEERVQLKEYKEDYTELKDISNQIEKELEEQAKEV
ncbi:MAG: hypothetical protein ACR5KV_05055 [Wolbachia sp.]